MSKNKFEHSQILYCINENIDYEYYHFTRNKTYYLEYDTNEDMRPCIIHDDYNEAIFFHPNSRLADSFRKAFVSKNDIRKKKLRRIKHKQFFSN